MPRTTTRRSCASRHYQFEAIHPFIDGNGRIGRLLITLLLVRDDLLPLPLLYLSAYFERHRQRYYDLLLGVSARGDWRSWIFFFLRGVAEQATDAVRRAKRLQDLQQRWRTQLTDANAPARLLQAVDVLFETPVVTISQMSEALDIPYQSALRYVSRLERDGILEQLGDDTYARQFYAKEVLRIITVKAGASPKEAPQATQADSNAPQRN